LLTPFKNCFKELKDKPWHVEGSDNAEWVLMDYVNVVVHVPNTNTRILQYREFVGDKNHCNSKQILKKKKRRMAKDNNPTPNKFKNPWLVYRYTAYLLFISFITGSSVYKNHQA
jgi:hypothetical protein